MTSVHPPSCPQTLPADVLQALREGRKIEAIKRLREARQLDLKQARDWIEAHEHDHLRDTYTRKPIGINPTSVWWWLLLLLTAAVLAYHALRAPAA